MVCCNTQYAKKAFQFFFLHTGFWLHIKKVLFIEGRFCYFKLNIAIFAFNANFNKAITAFNANFNKAITAFNANFKVAIYRIIESTFFAVNLETGV